MNNTLFDITAYLQRIQYHGKIDVSLETLKALHTGHVFNIPFENLDVFNKKPISLERDDLNKKMVVNKRGGYCFEMNGLFSDVLEQIGFQVTRLFARVWKDGFEQTGKTHQVLLVTIDDQDWLCDVGFGGNGPIAPILIEVGIEQEQFGKKYRIGLDPTFGYVLEYKQKGDFEPVYAFTLEKCYPQDYIIANHFTATYPTSFFTHVLICTRPTEDGRITLFDGLLKIDENESETETELGSVEEIEGVLQNYFGICEPVAIKEK